MLGDELGEVYEHAFERREIDRRHVSVALEAACDAGAFDHGPGERAIERRQAKRTVADRFDRLATLAEQHNRPEGGIERGTDDQLIGAGPLDHRLHGEALEARVGPRRAYSLDH